MSAKPEFAIGEIVYLKTAPTEPGMVTGIILRPQHCTYLVVWAEDRDERAHFAIEITDERKFVPED